MKHSRPASVVLAFIALSFTVGPALAAGGGGLPWEGPLQQIQQSITGPVAGFDGSWTISKRGVVATQPEALTRAATQEATAHCAVQGKRFRQIDLKESPSGLLAPRAETALTFVCE